MKGHEKMNSNKFGFFDMESDATYTITNPEELLTSWEYIYQNENILLKVDQNGPVYAQVKPVQDILLFKRESNEKYSKWVLDFVVQDGEVNKEVTLFSRKSLNPYKLVEIKFSPSIAKYTYHYEDFSIVSSFMVDNHDMSLIQKVEFINHSNKLLNVTLKTSLLPYANYAVMPPWDKPEWYLETNLNLEGDLLTFFSKKNSPTSEETERKTIKFQTYVNDSVKAQISLERLVGNGDFYEQNGTLDLKQEEIRKRAFDDNLVGYPSVYAFEYDIKVEPHKTYEVMQALNVYEGHKDEKAIFEASLLLEESHLENILKIKNDKFHELFNQFRINTNNLMFDYYINSFLPLQLHWIAYLDRGWPSGMRGVRDASNDFMGLMQYDPKSAENIILTLCSCQRTDGWFPRQVSANGKNGKHDLRKYNDGGVFLLELLFEYLKFTNDVAILDKKVSWLDSDEASTILSHMTQIFSYYTHKDSLGKHGLTKIYEGDWLDSINKAGLEGRGESVTISMQLVFALKQMIQMIKYFKLEKVYQLIPEYEAHLSQLEKNIEMHAYNKLGFYNGLYTDGDDWVFSDKDPDNVSRIYMTVNAFSIISGIAKGKKADGVIDNLLKLKTESGYRLFSPGLGKTNIPYLGRMGTGDQPIGLWENGSTYNHSSHGFFSRALSIIEDQSNLYEVIQYMLPFDESYHPIDKTLSAPYAMVNCYQDLKAFPHRGGLPFLTGTVAMAFRAIYQWMFGIQPEFGGLSFRPVLKEALNGSKVIYNYNGKKLNITFIKGDKELIYLNDALQEHRYLCPITNKSYRFIPNNLLKHGDEIIVLF